MNKKIINIIILIIWLLVIFLFSNQNGEQSSKTSGIFDNVISIFIKDESKKDTVKYYIRKCAHFTEYFILALLIINVIKDYHEVNYKLLLLTFILCILYAASDEWHQTFVDNRAGQLKDVIIDSSGSLLAIVLYRIRKILRK